MDVFKYLMRNLKYYRKVRDMTQKQLANLCSVSIGYIAELEKGRKFPSSTTLEKLISALEINPHELFYPNVGNLTQSSSEVENFSSSQNPTDYSKAVRMAKIVYSYVNEELCRYVAECEKKESAQSIDNEYVAEFKSI